MKRKANIWFVRVRGSYLPCSWQGWLSYIPMIGVLVLSLIVSFDQADSIVGALFIAFPYFVCTGVVMHWLAKQKS